MNNVEKIRAKHDLTQQKLADKLGCTKAAVSLIEKGRLTPEKADLIASVLHENVYDVWGVDVLKRTPKTQNEKERLLAIINSIEVK